MSHKNGIGSPNVSLSTFCPLKLWLPCRCLYLGVLYIFKLSTKILTAALLFYMCVSPPAVSHWHFHVVASTFISISGIFRNFNQHGGHVLLRVLLQYLEIFFVIFSYLFSLGGYCVIPGFSCSTIATACLYIGNYFMCLDDFCYWMLNVYSKPRPHAGAKPCILSNFEFTKVDFDTFFIWCGCV